MKLPRTVRGQLDFLGDLQDAIESEFDWRILADKDHGDKVQVASLVQSCMEKQARNRKTGTRPSWRNLWLMDSLVYLWFMDRKAWWGLCLDCGRGRDGKFLRRREMHSMMAARKPGKWLTAPGTCVKCAKEQANVA